MTTIEERFAYLDSPYFKKPLYGDFTAFYATIAVCTVIIVFLILFNVICGCCSKYKDYWQDRHTGNRWLVSIWSATPHKQPPLDFTELEEVSQTKQFPKGKFSKQAKYIVDVESGIHSPTEFPKRSRPKEEYVVLKTRESEI